jgi:hypothetical protein
MSSRNPHYQCVFYLIVGKITKFFRVAKILRVKNCKMSPLQLQFLCEIEARTWTISGMDALIFPNLISLK